MENSRFKTDAKQLVDLLFDTKILKETVTRDEMNGVEELVEYLLNSKFDLHLRCVEFTKKLEKIKID